MAVPKCKVSKAKGRSRSAQTFKLSAPNLIECPQCHELKKSHVVCPNCGYYNGELIVEPKKDDKE